MLKKLNNYLLVNFPLLWNTKVLQVLGIMLIGHLCFFIAGYFSINSVRALYSYYGRFYDSLEVNLIAVLILAIVFIIWLVFYLRNNPFKSYYPIKKTYLIKEFFIVLIIVFISLPLYNSYAYGAHLKILKLSQHVNPESDKLVVMQARCFVPSDYDQYEKQNSCDSIAVTEKREILLNLANRENNDKCNNYNTNSDYNMNEVETAVPTLPASNLLPDSIPDKEFSYLYYCLNVNNYENNYDNGYYNSEKKELLPNNLAEVTNYSINKNNKRWLLNKQKDSIMLAIDKLLTVCKKYQIEYNVSSKLLTEWCFENDKLEPFNIINTGDNSPSVYKGANKNDYYLELQNLETGIDKIKQEREKGFFNLVEWLIYIYFTLGIAIFIFMFRITRLKPWLVAIVGAGIVSILFGLIGSFSGGINVIYFYGVFIIVVGIITIVWVKKDQQKMASAVGLNWLAYTMGSFLMVIAYIIKENTDEIRKCINNYWVVIRPEMPIHQWLQQNGSTTLQYINIAFILLMMVFVIIPLAYKWQANKAE